MAGKYTQIMLAILRNVYIMNTSTTNRENEMEAIENLRALRAACLKAATEIPATGFGADLDPSSYAAEIQRAALLAEHERISEIIASALDEAAISLGVMGDY